jgi:hypothetical protein
MSATTNDLTTAPSRTPLLAALGIAASAVLTAVGTFWDITGNEPSDNHSASDYWPVLAIIAVTAAIVFGLVVRGAERGNPGRRSAVLGVVGVLSVAVFWAGLPMVLAAGSFACALADKDRRGSFGGGSKAGLALSALVTAGAVSAAIAG